ncbi:EcoAI/FtnUII family type I restriction enzme subunit R [Gillisia sp. JM1]|uniref:EcoAI/FtnUII family type I restriction enzme subunit R n=1 Tax=Gillisia sp. JM1 TaxID=1283286 RepID=UPI0003FDC8C9|nr:type I restriction endonuclease subunit R [Gillisia sp. JM1]
MNEAQTKHDLIEPALREAGWGIVEGSRLRLEFPITKGRLIGQNKRATALFADYVLEYNNRRIGVVEAKKRDAYYTQGVGQAKDYAERLNIRYTYSTNGLHIYGVDMEQGAEGDVSKYPTPEELWEMTYPTPKEEYKVEIANWKERLFAIPFEDRSGTWQPRYYQDNAITKTLEAVANKKDRILLTLATGTGKTAIAFQIAWKLFHAKWNLRRNGQRSPRILFLADRNILADQAFNAFNSFEEDALVRIAPDEIRKKGRVPKNGNIFFTIFQTFMSGPNDTPYFGDYPKDFFDFIIIDECHRGGANDESSWRDIMEHFSPAVQLGLTATPKRDVNTDTYKYFGDPVYIYSLKEGINDGFLTPFKVKEISTTIDEYEFAGDDDIEDGEIEQNKKYTEADFNRIIEIKEREAYRVKLFMDSINQTQKTLVFCATQIHAAAIRDLINQYSYSKTPNYCHRVTADDGGIGEKHLRDFQDNEKSIPTVLTTSRKLSTGVDAPEIRNIVLLREVKSMVEFKQIVGRGTRLFDGKDYFTVFDFVKAHEHFKDPSWDGEPIDPVEPKERTKKICDICGEASCNCASEPEPICIVCENDPCVCDTPPKKMIKIKLSDNKVRQFDSMVKTSFWSPTGVPISAENFIKQLFRDLPTFFKSEDELRKLWSLPSTRRKLLEELSEKGYSNAQLDDLRKLVHGEDSDLYDVLNYVAYHVDLVPRLVRAAKAKIHFNEYNPKQQEFLNFVLDQYVKEGVDELDGDKLSPLLILKYKAIADAKRELGDIPSIRNAFVGFQQHLYGQVVNSSIN